MQTSVNTDLWRSIKWNPDDSDAFKRQLADFTFHLSQWCAAINQALAAPAAILQLINSVSASISSTTLKSGNASYSPLANETFDCTGLSYVFFNCVFTAGGGVGPFNLSLTHLRQGVLVFVQLQNVAASNGTVGFGGSTNESGSAITATSIVDARFATFQTVLTCAPGKGVLGLAFFQAGTAIMGLSTSTA